MDAVLRELRQVYAEAADPDRPWLVGTVVDTGRYTTVGAGFVAVAYGDARYEVVYRDGPEPAIGSLIEFKRANRHPDSWYFARPLPQVVANICAGNTEAFIVSARSLADGAWKILRCDFAGGVATWQVLADHPGGGGDYRPLVLYGLDFLGTARLFTWVPGDQLYYSDDTGVTWTAASGTSGINSFAYPAIDTGTGTGFATTPGGGIATTDWGASWGASIAVAGAIFGVGDLNAAANAGHTYATVHNGAEYWTFKDGFFEASYPNSLDTSKLRWVSRGFVQFNELGMYWMTDTSTTSANVGGEPAGYVFGGDGGGLILHPAAGGESWSASGVGGDILAANRGGGEGYVLRPFLSRSVFGGNWTYYYQNNTNHPTGKVDVGIRAGAPGLDCVIAALDEADAGDSQFAAAPLSSLVTNAFTGVQSDPPNYMPAPFMDISAPMVAQIGAKFVASRAGLVVLP